MPQVSLYIDKELYKEVESIVKKKDVSMSSFVSNVLKEYLDNSWPEGYFELFESMKEDPLEEPEELSFSLDAPRESF